MAYLIRYLFDRNKKNVKKNMVGITRVLSGDGQIKLFFTKRVFNLSTVNYTDRHIIRRRRKNTNRQINDNRHRQSLGRL